MGTPGMHGILHPISMGIAYLGYSSYTYIVYYI